MTDATLRYMLVTGLYVLASLVFARMYRSKLDGLVCDKDGNLAASKIGTIVASTAWTHYMLVGDIKPEHTMMWLAFFTATAATELFKKLMSMWFSGKAGIAPPNVETVTTETKKTQTTTNEKP